MWIHLRVKPNTECQVVKTAQLWHFTLNSFSTRQWYIYNPHGWEPHQVHVGAAKGHDTGGVGTNERSLF